MSNVFHKESGGRAEPINPITAKAVERKLRFRCRYAEIYNFLEKYPFHNPKAQTEDHSFLHYNKRLCLYRFAWVPTMLNFY